MRMLLISTVLLAFFVLPVSSSAGTSEYSMTLGVGEEYNSNVNEKHNAKADWVSKAITTGSVKYNSARVSLEGGVNGSFNVYALGNRNDEFKGSGKINSKVTVAEELLFVEANGSFQQVYSNLIRGETNPTDSTRNQVNQYTVVGKAYVTPHLADRLSIRIGYDFTAYIYGDASSSNIASNSISRSNGNGGAINKVSHTIYAETAYELTPVFQVTFAANGMRQFSANGGVQRAYANAGFKWQFSEDGHLSAKAGPTYSKYDNGSSSLTPFVEVVATQAFQRYTLGASLSSKYVENPSSAYSSMKSAAGVSLGWTGDRLSLQARASYSVMDGEDTVSSDQLSLGINAKYQVTPRLAISAGGSREETLTKRYTQVRWYANGSVIYDLGKNFSLEGYYNWKVYDSTQSSISNYSVNIVGLSLKKTF